MGNIYKSTKVTQFSSRILGFVLATAMAVPAPAAFAGGLDGINSSMISKGNTQAAVPDVATICDSIDKAQSGNFIVNGQFKVVKSSCLSLPKRQQIAEPCQENGPDVNALAEVPKQAKLDEICGGNGANLSSDAKTYCAIRNATKGGQAEQYCAAYKNAEKAQKGVTITATLDAAAAGICWAEAISMKKLRVELAEKVKAKELKENKWSADNKGAPCPPGMYALDFNVGSAMGPGSIFNKGICGAAAMAAGVGELIQTSRMVFGKGKNHSAGNETIDSDGNVQDRKGLPKLIESVASAGLSLTAIQLGICYYSPNAGICKNINNIKAMQSTKMNGGTLSSALQQKQTATTNYADYGNIKDSNDYANEQLRRDQSNLDALKGPSAQPEAATIELNGPLPDNMKNTWAPTSDINAKPPGGSAFDAPTRQQRIEDAERQVKNSQAAVDVSHENLVTLQRMLDSSTATANQVGMAFAARANLAHQAALLFTGLTAMRAIALTSASGTKNKAKGILQSMFQQSNLAAPLGTGGAAIAGNSGIYASTAAGTYNPTAGSGGGTQSLATAAGTPESFLLPPGSPTSNLAGQIASQIPPKKMEEAAAGGAAGVGGLIASTAGTLGLKDPNEIHSVMASAFANLPKDDGAGYSGGGGHSVASKGGNGGGGGDSLDLKGLFGGAGGDKPEQAAAANDVAYRGPASDDIWHSQNPKGNNLFQIISDRYDTAQRNSDMSR
jgi:hypothetical protein